MDNKVEISEDQKRLLRKLLSPLTYKPSAKSRKFSNAQELWDFLMAGLEFVSESGDVDDLQDQEYLIDMFEGEFIDLRLLNEIVDAAVQNECCVKAGEGRELVELILLHK